MENLTVPENGGVTRRLKVLIWFNVAVQAIFPLGASFTPAMAGAAEQHLLKYSKPLSALRTRPYTMVSGDTVATVARQYHLSVVQLRELNQLRTFARGFDNLCPGDELDVPLSPLPEVQWDATTETGCNQEDAQAARNAGYASQAGSFLTSGANGDAAASTARGMVTGETGGALQQWLSRFGTARVQLDADRSFSLKNSQFDLLLPLYERDDNLAFTQGSLHRTDGRTQANLGGGLRHFTHTYMLGGNLFGDYDLSRKHARTGAGLEYWRDFLKLGANGYLRLTGWKDAPELADWQARPANGWDVRAQAWLPGLPQLGTKLTYEQYYGQEVALFGVDNRRKNPRAVTAGVNYTPVPLVTLGAERRQGQSGRGESRLSLDMNWQPGVPWRAQVNPDAVAVMRSLAGSRYDLVERNNSIVLEYRKKELIRLRTAGLVTGYAGEQKSLGVQVTSAHGLYRIDWDTQALSAAGGKIVKHGADYAVVLPAYQPTAQAVNTYTVSGVAVDTKGNRSERSDTQVTVQAPVVSKRTSTFTPEKSVLPADGKSTQVLTVTLRDENNRAADMDVQSIRLNVSGQKSSAVSALSRQSAGVYAVTVNAGRDNEILILTPSAGSTALSTAVVTVISSLPDPSQSRFSAAPETIIADNAAVSTLTLIMKDAQGSALTGLKDGLKFTVKDSGGREPAAGVITLSAVTESGKEGAYTATLKGTMAGRYIVTPVYNGEVMGSLSATVTLAGAMPAPQQSLIRLDKTTYAAGEDITLTAMLKDAQGNPVMGQKELLETGVVSLPGATPEMHSNRKSGALWNDSGNGTYSAIFTASKAETNLRASLKLTGWNQTVESEIYTISAGEADENHSAIAINNNSKSFLPGERITVVITLRDKFGNALIEDKTGGMISNAVMVPNSQQSGNWSRFDNGEYTDAFIGSYIAKNKGYGLRAKLTLSGWTSSKESDSFSISRPGPDETFSTIKTDKRIYSLGSDIKVTVVFRDENDNPVSRAPYFIRDEVEVPNAELTSEGWARVSEGAYTATYAANKTGVNLKAKLKVFEWEKSNESPGFTIE